MADAASCRIAKSARFSGAITAAGRAGYIVLGAIGQDFQALFEGEGDHGCYDNTAVRQNVSGYTIGVMKRSGHIRNGG